MAVRAVTDKTLRAARGSAYPKQVLYLVVSFIAFVSLCHFLSVAYRYATRRRVWSRKRTPTTSIVRLPLAIVDSIRALTMRWTVPIGSSYTLNFAELFVVVGYIGVLLSWTFVNTTTLEGQRVEPHYYANRAGLIAASQLPILVALGMKNNLISAITGIGFDKLNFLHRMAARSFVILAWVHGGGRLIIGLTGDETVNQPWIRCGFLAASSLSLLTLLSIRPLRQRNYELFLIVHHVLALLFCVGVLVHLAGRSLSYYGAWPALVVWGFDRVLSMGKAVVFNFSYFNPWSKASKDLDARVEVLSHHFLKITVLRSKYFFWRPGQSAYLTFPTVSSLPFESHPFTISSIYHGPSADENKLVFFLRVHKGLTARLMDAASKEQMHKVLVSGPYGTPPILVGYQSIMLFAGGSGVTFTLPLFLSAIDRAKHGEPTCERLTFVWVVRDADQLRWIEDVLASAIEGLPKTISVSIRLYVTGVVGDAEAFAETDSSSEDLEEAKSPTTPSTLVQYDSVLFESPLTSLNQGRPDLNALIQAEIAEDAGSISINVCGTTSLAEAVRRAIRVPRPLDVLRGGPTVSLHIEPFGI